MKAMAKRFVLTCCGVFTGFACNVGVLGCVVWVISFRDTP